MTQHQQYLTMYCVKVINNISVCITDLRIHTTISCDLIRETKLISYKLQNDYNKIHDTSY